MNDLPLIMAGKNRGIITKAHLPVRQTSFTVTVILRLLFSSIFHAAILAFFTDGAVGESACSVM
ncbi:hypothetical protein GCM10011571_03460 [Marinithermofilum abyssi]|uniref:Uncharacterized protein n=1 Tax=Marinithermofilum abyssi TaxID=1571185 RepID=A0A8J2YC98_9BACL|nr:hypothetical protein GCM10011571_03460 [Marinithermofilum abyssi]